MEFEDILDVLVIAASKKETVEIYYPKTENSGEGWREVEPYSISTDVGREGEHLVLSKEIVSPGHILNASNVGSNHCSSFIFSKIKKARPTGRKFIPRWPVEFI